MSQFHDSLGYYPGLRYHFDANPDNEGLYFWDAAASLVVPATGDYTTKVTWDDKSPATDLYGVNPYGDTVLGSGDPRDNGVQYGLNIAVLDKDKRGSWGKIAVWNATTLVKLGMHVNLAKAHDHQVLVYQLKVRNVSPASQPYTVSDPIPKGTTFAGGRYYDRATNRVTWTGTIGAHDTRVIEFKVNVDHGTPHGATITNTATLSDDASGSSASATTVVK